MSFFVRPTTTTQTITTKQLKSIIQLRHSLEQLYSPTESYLSVLCKDYIAVWIYYTISGSIHTTFFRNFFKIFSIKLKVRIFHPFACQVNLFCAIFLFWPIILRIVSVLILSVCLLQLKLISSNREAIDVKSFRVSWFENLF